MNRIFVKKIISYSAVIAVIVSVGISPLMPALKVQAAGAVIGKVTGWGWSYMPDKTDQNDTQWQNAVHVGNVGAGVGWLAFDYGDYGGSMTQNSVTIDADGTLHGWIWSEYVGWIQLDPAGPYPDPYRTSSPFNPSGIPVFSSSTPPPSNSTPPPASSGTPQTPVSASVNTGTPPVSSSSGGTISQATLNDPSISSINDGSTDGGRVIPGGFFQNLFQRVFGGDPALPASSTTTTTTEVSESTVTTGFLRQFFHKVFGTKNAYAATLGSAAINLNTGQWYGWARATRMNNGSVDSTKTGGWDGWILLGGVPGYGVSTPSIATGCTQDCATQGFAWGDTVMGWIGMADVKVSLTIDMCTNIPGDQPTVPSNAIQVGTECDYCQNLSNVQNSVPNGLTQDPWTNGQGFNCMDEEEIDVVCPNSPPGGLISDWLDTPGNLVDSVTGYCRIGDTCPDPTADNYGRPGDCIFLCKNPNAINEGDPLPCEFPPGWCETHPEDCPVVGGKPIYEET